MTITLQIRRRTEDGRNYARVCLEEEPFRDNEETYGCLRVPDKLAQTILKDSARILLVLKTVQAAAAGTDITTMDTGDLIVNAIRAELAEMVMSRKRALQPDSDTGRGDKTEMTS